MSFLLSPVLVGLLAGLFGAHHPAATHAPVLARAEALLVSRCMAQRGLSGYPVVPTGTSTGGRGDPLGAWFARLSPRRRHAALQAVDGKTFDGLRVRLPGAGVIERSATSCTSVAEDQLYGDVRAWYRSDRLAEALPQLAHNDTYDAPDPRAAYQRRLAALRHRYRTQLQIRRRLRRAALPRARRLLARGPRP